MEKEKTFDAVKTVRKIRDAHYDLLKDKTVDERLAFYREKSKALRSQFDKHRERTNQ